MNTVINADFTGLELRIEAMMANMKADGMSIDMSAVRPRGKPLFAFEDIKHGTPLGFLSGLVRDGLHAPNTTTMHILKRRTSDGPIRMDIDTPYIHRLRSGLQ